jgi:hypothetical protein
MGAIDALNAVERALTAPYYRLMTARLGTRLMHTGAQSTATVDGIKATHSDIGGLQDMWLFALTVRPRGGERFRAGCKQHLTPLSARGRVHLGMELPVRHKGHRVVIDWPAMLRGWGIDPIADTPDGWRPLGKPPADGIDDHRMRGGHRRRLERGRRTQAEVIACEHAMGMMGRDERWNVRLRLVDDGRELTLEKVEPPDYAVHMIGLGARIPVAVDPDRPERVTVDWVAGSTDPALLAGADARLDRLLGVVAHM